MAPWMASLLTVLAMAAILGGVYFWAAAKNTETTNAASSAQAGAGAPTVEPAKGGGSDFAKNLELAGFRITEDKTQKIQVRFLVINHSNAELPPLDGDVTLRVGRADTTIDFPFKLPSMAPMESREVTSVTKADVRAYELPDWQFIKPEFRVSEAKK